MSMSFQRGQSQCRRLLCTRIRAAARTTCSCTNIGSAADNLAGLDQTNSLCCPARNNRVHKLCTVPRRRLHPSTTEVQKLPSCSSGMWERGSSCSYGAGENRDTDDHKTKRVGTDQLPSVLCDRSRSEQGRSPASPFHPSSPGRNNGTSRNGNGIAAVASYRFLLGRLDRDDGANPLSKTTLPCAVALGGAR